MALPMNDVPNYTTTLPASGKKVTFRPYLVKEKKILMLAREEGSRESILTATSQIVENCTMGKLHSKDLPLVDLQHLFLKIRAKSVGEVAEFNFECSNCKDSIPASVNLDEIAATINPKHTKTIILDDATKYGVTMKYPTIEAEKIISSGMSQTEIELNLMAECIDKVFRGAEIYEAKDSTREELLQMIENLTTTQYEKISDFFATMPQIETEITKECLKCKAKNILSAKDIIGFFG